jgi:hypothetical protein
MSATMDRSAVINARTMQSYITPSATLVFGALFAVALMPILWFGIPVAMVDYSNHLARMFVISRDGGFHPHPYYQVTWSFVPNLAMDILVPRAGRLIGVETANRLFYLLSQILIVTGAMAIERVVKGRVHIAGFIAVMFLYSLPFAWGFANFEFGLGCALWGIACAMYVEHRSWPTRLAVHTAIVALLFIAHMFALGIYGFAVGVHELWRGWSRRTALLEIIGRLAPLAAPSVLLFFLMISTGGSVGGSGTYWFFARKFTWLLHILSGYTMLVSSASVAALVWLAVALGRRGGLKFKQSGAWLLAGFSLLYLAMPFSLFDTAFVDMRVIVGACLILPAFVSVSFPNQNWARAVTAAVIVIMIAQVWVVTSVWISYRADFAAAMRSFELLPKGAIVLVGHSTDGADPPADLRDYPIYNVPTLAVHYADAFVPSLFTDPGKQPVTPRTPWQRLDVPYGNILPAMLLKEIAEHGAPPGTPRFVQTWQKDFEYLYLVGPSIPNPMPDRLELVLAASRFVLYRVKKGV